MNQRILNFATKRGFSQACRRKGGKKALSLLFIPYPSSFISSLTPLSASIPLICRKPIRL
jgi:hypothetical protein